MHYSSSMSGRTLFRVGFLALFLGQSHLAPCRAQSAACIDISPKQPETPPGQKLILDNVEVQGPNPLTFSQWSTAVIQIKNAALENHYDPNDSRAFNELVEPVRTVLQNEGYFHPVVAPNPYLVGTDGDTLHYRLGISINPGRQYRLAEVHFRTAKPDDPVLAFSETELRQQIDLRPGDLFDVSKVNEGLDSLRKLYRSKGFIDMFPTSDTHVHDASEASNGQYPSGDSTIDLTLVLDQGKPYHIVRIDILGLSLEAVRQLQLPQQAGDLFLPDLWARYITMDSDPASARAVVKETSSYSLVESEQDHSLSIRLNYGPCPDPSAVPIIYSEATLPTDSVSPPIYTAPPEDSQDRPAGDSATSDATTSPAPQ